MSLRLVLLGGILLLVGCATPPLLEPTTDPQRLDLWLAHQNRLKQVERWRAEGRAAILARDSGGQVAFDWQHEPSQQRLNIRTPLGQNVMQLTQNDQGVMLIDHEGTTYQGSDGEAMLRETLGWSVPLDAMHAWLLGLPATPNDAYNVDEMGRLKHLHSKGWHIDYQRYTLVQGIPLPGRLELTHTDLTLRLIVDRWRL